ncbi:hypothetical protein ACSQ67_013837 [Phaseolus vulgaris]
MIDAIGAYGPNLPTPSYHEIRVPLLDKEVEYTEKLLKDHKLQWSETWIRTVDLAISHITILVLVLMLENLWERYRNQSSCLVLHANLSWFSTAKTNTTNQIVKTVILISCSFGGRKEIKYSNLNDNPVLFFVPSQ